MCYEVCKLDEATQAAVNKQWHFQKAPQWWQAKLLVLAGAHLLGEFLHSVGKAGLIRNGEAAVSTTCTPFSADETFTAHEELAVHGVGWVNVGHGIDIKGDAKQNRWGFYREIVADQQFGDLMDERFSRPARHPPPVALTTSQRTGVQFC